MIIIRHKGTNMVIYNSKKYHQTLICEFDKNKKNYSFKYENEKIVFNIIPDKFSLANFYFEIRKLLTQLQQEINVDIDSFNKVLDDKYNNDIFLIFLSCCEWVNNPSFSLKTLNAKKEETTNFIFSNSKIKNIKESEIIVDAETFARKLINMPANYLTIKKYISEVRAKFKNLNNISIKIIDASKFGLISAVNRGSEEKPIILMISYKNSNSPSKAYIGKGILFDTGGIDLKPSNFLKNMHFDMSGAAIVTAVMYAIAKNNIKTNVVGLMPLTRNSIDGQSIVPGDVIKSYDGITVEVTNTDAEGRLILADTITYAKKNCKVKDILTIATLTGAADVAFGNIYTPIWSNNDEYFEKIKSSSDKAGELIWRMPFHNEYKKRLFNTNIGDINNGDNNRQAGASVAAHFLELFANPINFIHCDIAGTNEINSKAIPILLRTLYEMSNK